MMMVERVNEFGQRIGPEVAGWREPSRPSVAVMEGRYCRLERLAEGHAAWLHREFSSGTEADWTYLAYGPFESEAAYAAWVRENCRGEDPLFYAVIVEGKAVGVASYLRIAPAVGSIEVGHIHLGRSLRRTPAATEAMYLMMRYAFELGYRRYEWKCDALNRPSRAAAQRLGFSFEGVFRNATMYKGRSRDTAWFAVTDGDWAGLRGAFERWLAAGNFDGQGRQRERLSDLTRARLRNLCDPFAG
jgi:RimJ/RimL family protein N-acetyltransferase